MNGGVGPSHTCGMPTGLARRGLARRDDEVEAEAGVDVRFHTEEVTAASHALDAAAQSQGLLHQREMFADDSLLLNGGFANAGIEFPQAEHFARGEIVVQVPARALAEGIEPAGGVAVVCIDDEVSRVFAEHRQQEIQIQERDIGDGHEQGCAGPVCIPLIERQHERGFARNLQSGRLELHHLQIPGMIGPAASATKNTPSSLV
jgi:hypothetical protein